MDVCWPACATSSHPWMLLVHFNLCFIPTLSAMQPIKYRLKFSVLLTCFFFFQWPTHDIGLCHFWFGVDFKLRLCLILIFGSPSSSKIPSSPHSSYFSVYTSVLDLILSTALASWQGYLDQIMASTTCLLPSKGPSGHLFGETTIWENLLYKPKILTCLQMTMYRSHSTFLHFWYHHVFKWKHPQFYAELFHLTTNIY